MRLVIDTNVLVEAITSDHHYNVLKETQFPKVNVISPDDFIKSYL